MKLPGHLLRTYRRYKKEEAEVIDWVCKTAKSCGLNLFKDDLVAVDTDHNDEKTTPRKRNSSDTNNGRGRQPKGAVAIFDILEPVEAILKSPDTSQIPVSIVEKLQNVLDLRQKCLAWFRANTSQTDKVTRERNDKHQYPVTILKRALGLLRSKLGDHTTIRDENKQTKLQKTAKAGTDQITAAQDDHKQQDDCTVTSDDVNDVDDDRSRPIAKKTVSAPLLRIELSYEERIQDEYYLGHFCLYEDLAELEDYMFLEFVSYSLDQRNSNVLPYLVNATVDRALQMEHALLRSFDIKGVDLESLSSKFFDRLFGGILTGETVASFITIPLLRTQFRIWCELAQQRLDKVYQTVDEQVAAGIPVLTYTPNSIRTEDYFACSEEDQGAIERGFIRELWRTRPPKSYQPFATDLSTKVIDDLRNLDLSEGKMAWIGLGFTLAIRLRFLLTRVLRSNCDLPYAALHKSAKASGRADLELLVFHKSNQRHEADGATSKYTQDGAINLEPKQHLVLQEAVTGPLAAQLRSNPVLCCLNVCVTQMYSATTLVGMMDKSRITRLLAHFWNLFHKLRRVRHSWSDLECLIEMLGEDFFFQGEAPTLALLEDDTAMRRRFMYAMGGIMKKTKRSTKDVFTNQTEVRFNGRPKKFINSDIPVFWHLDHRNDHTLTHIEAGSTDLELIITATTIRQILGEKPIEIKLEHNKTTFGDRAALWRLRDLTPDFDNVTLLCLVKKALQHDMRIMNFEHLKFLKGCSQLVNDLYNELEQINQRSFPSNGVSTTKEKIETVTMDFLNNFHGYKADRMASVMSTWMATNAEVGSKQQRRVPIATTYPLSLQPGQAWSGQCRTVQDSAGHRPTKRTLRSHLHETTIVGHGLSTTVTKNLEEHVRQCWAENSKRKGKKSKS